MWEALHTAVRERLGRMEGREACPSYALLDSQSTKTTDKGGPAGISTIGYDAHKKVNGRKRHLLTDAQGLVLSVEVTAANVPEQNGARQLLEPLRGVFSRLQGLMTDQGYRGSFGDWVQEH